MLAIFLISIAAASASDVNDTVIASGGDGQIELSAGDEITGDNLQTSEENPTLAIDDNDETVSAQTNSEILTDDQYTYSDLREQIGTGGNKNLTKGIYTYNNDGDAIVITTSGVINGNGAVIDMAGSTIQAFSVSASGVIIKNLTIKNANFNGDGGAIYFSGSGTVENCNFTNNHASEYGGAIWIYSGTVTNCNFADNTATYGGAVYFLNTGNVTNCNFADNKATGDYSYGGAVYFYQGTGTVSNCNFTGNSAIRGGGAVSFYSTGTVSNCNFTGNKATGDNAYGGAISFNGKGSVSNCNFINNKASTYGGAIYIYSQSNINLCNFTNCHTDSVNTSKDGAIYDRSGNSIITNCIFDGIKSADDGNTTPSTPSQNTNTTNTTNSTPSQNTNPTNTQTTTTKTTKTTLTLKKVKVKKSAEKLVISATIKINGKVKKGLKVKFKFNKKTYTAKTDKKGVAKITIKKSVLKKLKAGKKVTYSAIYNKTTKKYTVKIQK